MSEKPDDTIRKQVVRQIIDALGGQGLVACAYHGALPCTGAHKIGYLFPDTTDPEANVSRQQVVFDQEKHILQTYADTVGLAWTTNGIGQSVQFFTIVQPDDTYSVFLIRKRRQDARHNDGIPYVLIAEAHDVYFDVLKGVVNQMFDDELARRH